MCAYATRTYACACACRTVLFTRGFLILCLGQYGGETPRVEFCELAQGGGRACMSWFAGLPETLVEANLSPAETTTAPWRGISRQPAWAGNLAASRISLGMSAARFEPMEVEDGESCTVCMSRPRTVRNQPCGHAMLCELCTIKMIKSRTIDCPLCRWCA